MCQGKCGMLCDPINLAVQTFLHRDIAPWRVSDASHRSAWKDPLSQRRKTCTECDLACRVLARSGLVPTGKWSRDLASAVDEELRHRAERPVLQGDDPNRSRRNGQYDRQHLERQAFAAELQHGAGEYSKISPGRDQA